MGGLGWLMLVPGAEKVDMPSLREDVVGVRAGLGRMTAKPSGLVTALSGLFIPVIRGDVGRLDDMGRLISLRDLSGEPGGPTRGAAGELAGGMGKLSAKSRELDLGLSLARGDPGTELDRCCCCRFGGTGLAPPP